MTAVEWLQDKLNNVRPTQICSIETIKEWVEQAKEMEAKQRQQLVDDAITNYENGWADKKASSQTTSEKWKEYQDWLNEVPELSSQTERMYSEEDYIHSHTDAIAFISHLQHNTLYEVLDLANNKWDKQKYTFLVDKNEQEETQKMIHSFRMGWIKKLKNK